MRIHHIISVSVFALLVAACTKNISVQSRIPEYDQAYVSSVIDASCSVIQLNDSGQDRLSAGMMTKSIIGQTTITEAIDANFIKLDEVRREWTREEYEREQGPAVWSDERTAILNAEVLSSPDNTTGIHFRSIVFNPRQLYQYYSYDEDGDPGTTNDEIIVGYISRMVGWYPKTFKLLTDADGKPADTRFVDATGTYRVVDGHVCVCFKNQLNGETDVMMTDMREGRYDLRSSGFRNNERDYDVQPYGHMFQSGADGVPSAKNGYQYCNYFTFNHYLTGIRLFVKADESDLSLISWKQINDVIFTNQPSTVTIALPTEQSRGGMGDGLVDGTTATLPAENVAPVFGKAVLWEDFQNMSIIRTPMAENDPDHPEFAETPEYPVEMDHGVTLDKAYLGYMLVQPDEDTAIEIHTDAGIFSAIIPALYPDKGTGGTAGEQILKAGHIYNIVIDIKADGSLDVVIGNENEDRFRNLAPYNEEINDFEYSNCYVITPDMFSSAENNTEYEGFYFQAMVAGRGPMGLISSVSADLYPDDVYFDPYSARILWQDENYLITHVELVHGYVRFTLNEECRTQGKKGNAVIAVYDRDGNIIWSWHIWVTDELADKNYSLVYNGNLKTFSVMNMNLGARKATCTGSDDAVDTYGLYYLWGRKDPSPGPPSYNYSQADTRTMDYWYMDQGVKSSVDVITDAYPTMEMSARHPLSLLMPSRISEIYSNDWLYESIDQLWGYSPSAGEVVKKTIYDPCPYGYRVADDELKQLFDYCYTNNNRYDDENYGLMTRVDGVANFFPYTGWRGHDAGRTDRTLAWYGVGKLGDYQDARVCKDGSVENNHRGRNFVVKGGSHQVENGDKYDRYIYIDWGNRASAAPVRCVRYNSGPEQEP